MQKVLFLVIISLFTSCKLVRTVIELKRENPKIFHINYYEKDILFIPMHHLGKSVFYDNVKNIVVKQKSNGYRVYYELVSTDFTTDSLLKDTIRRKARKLKGFSGTYKDNANENLFKKYIQQPSYNELGIDSSDMRADVNYLQLIQYWEKVNGEILLDSIDIHTPFNEKFNKGTFYTKKEYNTVFIQFRNKYLLDLIKNSSDTKILILYGYGHYSDFKKKTKSK